MARTAHISGFQSSETECKSLLARIGSALMMAFEARAIYRVQQEAGHLLSEKQLASMKAEFEKRHAAAQR